LGDQTLVGERGSILGETDIKSMRDFSGQEVQLRLGQTSIWINRADHRALELKRGSIFEGFKDMDCALKFIKQNLRLPAN
jgi:hypothetical protein